jgi:ketosteroid isomerase-like protein
VFQNRTMTSSTDHSIETAKAILQIESNIMAAIKAKDAASLGPMLADEFIYRTHFGAESNKDEFLESIAAFPIEILSLRGDELKVNVYGEMAVLTGIQRAEARVPEGEAEESAVAFTDVFVCRDGRWLMVQAYGVELPSESEPLQTNLI